MRSGWPRLALAVALAATAGAPARAAADASDGEGAPAWSPSASLYAFFVPDDRDFLNPNVAVDRGGLHLEARYNYEAYEAGSAWVGWNLAWGEELTLELTPMIGGVFGSVYGVAPGWLLSLGWRDFSLSSQGEWLLDVSGMEKSFLYTWSELDWSPAEWFRAGVAIQRTKAYRTSLDVQRGPFVGFSYESLELAGYVFNLGWTDPTVVVALSGSW